MFSLSFPDTQDTTLLDFFSSSVKHKNPFNFICLSKNISYTWCAIITCLMIWSEKVCQFFVNIPGHVITSRFVCTTIEPLEFWSSSVYILIWSYLIRDFKRLNIVEEGINLGLQVKMWPNYKIVASYLKKEIDLRPRQMSCSGLFASFLLFRWSARLMRPWK